jgi:hypothetical protein
MASLCEHSTSTVNTHVVISGTGRAGTTFLVHLLTVLGLDTGFHPQTLEVLPHAKPALLGRQGIYPIARAGLEMNLFSAHAPYIVKTPFLCNSPEKRLATAGIQHAIIPVRRFAAAAASRAYVQQQTTGSPNSNRMVPGGLWLADSEDSQVEVLRKNFTTLIETLVRLDIPVTFLMYPRLIRDPAYVYSKLRTIFNTLELVTVQEAYRAIVRPEWVHEFTENDH